MYFKLSFVENRFACNQNLVCLLSPNFDILASVCIANKDLFLSLMNIGFSKFLSRYKYICSVAKNPKMLNILSIPNLCFFWDNYAFETLCKKFISQIVRGIYSVYSKTD